MPSALPEDGILRDVNGAPEPAASYLCDFCGNGFNSKRAMFGHRVGKHLRGLSLKNATIKLAHLTDAQKGYLAAFLDGEGGIQITRTFRQAREYKLALHPTVYFTNSNREVIQRLRDWLCVGSVVHRKEPKPHKDMFILHVTGTRNVLELLRCLILLMIIKARQADVMIRYCESRLSHYRGNDRQFNELELELYTALSKLNKKGV